MPTLLLTFLAALCLLAALLPTLTACANLAALRRRPPAGEVDAAAGADAGSLVSILVPARDEAGAIAACVGAALASTGVPVEVIVGDDGSTDGTGDIVRALGDPRVRVVAVPPLPPGWSGKNHACARIAGEAGGTHLLFIDADVRLEPGAAAALRGHAVARGAALLSAVPRQRMGSLGEMLTVPMINLLLLGYLPIPLMRARPDPALGAACGQLILFEAGAYRATGGHAAARASLHDGVALPGVFRRAGYRTDLAAGAGLATCRMYRGFGQAWAGFTKNAHEGMATARGLPVWTALLGLGHVLPPLLVLAGCLGWLPPAALALAAAALLLSLGTRAAITLASREPAASVALHPAIVAVALALQWNALLRRERAGAGAWKGRRYAASRGD